MSLRHFTFLLLLGSVALLPAACGGPALEGFFEGGISGFTCPPGTEASGSCFDPDCTVDCVLTTSCEAGQQCPDRTKCGAFDGESWCLPLRCEAGCTAGEKCDELTYAQPICVTKLPD